MSNHEDVDHYGASYDNFASRLYGEIRQEAFGEDIGQTGWQTVEEQDRFISWLGVTPESELLNIACGSGRPSLRLVDETGCTITGIDIHEEAIAEAREHAQTAGLEDRASFEEMDASEPLPFPDESFDGLICIDAINHLPDRGRVLDDWFRVLRPGGRVVFTDPITVTGPLNDEEMRIRSSIGYYLFVPQGTDEELLARAGFEVREVEDRTDDMARSADRWRSARAAREEDLRDVEGDETFEGQQTFFRVTARLAEERRLSRFAFCAHAKKQSTN